MDIYADDPLGKIRVTREGIREIGRRIAAMNVPTALIMEGGYNNEALGENVAAFLDEFASPRAEQTPEINPSKT